LRRSWLIVLFGVIGTSANAQSITVSGLLKQMTDLTWLTARPQPYFKMAQVSSYDRASTSPSDPKTWFANADAGQYLSKSEHDGITEYVMADLKGPGAVVRIWSANPDGLLRFYFDGESTPRFRAKTADLLNGKVAPFGMPFSYPSSTASNGCNLYFPFPYAKSLKITVDSSGAGGAKSMYYHVGYRTYQPGTTVQTFNPSMLPRLKAAMDLVRKKLATVPDTSGAKVQTLTSNRVPGAGWKLEQRSQKGGMLRSLSIKIPFPLVVNIRAMDWDDIYQPHNVMRNVMLKVVCDGITTVYAPLGDFFATVPGPNEYHSFPMTVDKDGTLTCYFPMPFKRKIEVSTIVPRNIAVPMKVVAKFQDRPFTKDSYYFNAHWNIDAGSTRPMRDMEFLNAKGEGLWVGTHLHVTNPVGDWWGEGDEKVWVDGESFPSTFGTGSEDYFGYAWSSPNLFDRPYHGQVHCDGPGTYGHVSVHRWQTFDPISFSRSIKFDMEMWHWRDCQARYAQTSYWYAKPGSTSVEKRIRPGDLTLLELRGPKPVKGAIEGESLKYEKTGGETSVQEGFFELSAGKQLWWVQAKEGDRLTIHVPVKSAGRYEIVGNFCHARDYGIHNIKLLGAGGSSTDIDVDFYGTGVTWKKQSLGTLNLDAGELTMVVSCKGRNPLAAPGQMFGLDYLILTRK
jgi:hypothetical protein